MVLGDLVGREGEVVEGQFVDDAVEVFVAHHAADEGGLRAAAHDERALGIDVLAPERAVDEDRLAAGETVVGCDNVMRPAVGEFGYSRPAIAAVERHVQLLVITTSQMQPEREAGAGGHGRLRKALVGHAVILKAQQHATVAVFLAVDFVVVHRRCGPVRDDQRLDRDPLGGRKCAEAHLLAGASLHPGERARGIVEPDGSLADNAIAALQGIAKRRRQRLYRVGRDTLVAASLVVTAVVKRPVADRQPHARLHFDIAVEHRHRHAVGIELADAEFRAEIDHTEIGCHHGERLGGILDPGQHAAAEEGA